ncbi:hypothetical protein GTN31_08970 [Macrococcoides canis]|uniref:hypothetical protein n=1 Tax=Macrococcoides canis TaxID=1855823 RepID=UPI0013E98432|nr:hypothetical protein [Macrococcus canis]QIH76492.1 hypothetical protein GTN31_08970 [Macrococcus canis]
MKEQIKKINFTFKDYYSMFKRNFLLPLLVLMYIVLIFFNILNYWGNGFGWSDMPKYHQNYLIFIFIWILLMIFHQAFCVVIPVFRDESKFTWPKIIVDLTFVQVTLQVGLFGILMGKVGFGSTDSSVNVFGLIKIYIIYISVNLLFFIILGLFYRKWINTNKKVYWNIFLTLVLISLVIAFYMAQSNFGYDVSGAPIVDERPLIYAGMYFAFSYLMYLIVSVRNIINLSILLNKKHLASNYVPKEGEIISDEVSEEKKKPITINQSEKKRKRYKKRQKRRKK